MRSKYSDAWVFNDTDGLYSVCAVKAGDGHIDIIPHTHESRAEAEHIAKSLLAQ